MRVMRPRLIQQVEEDWVGRKGAPGRWRLRVRADGSPSGAPEFCAIERGECDLGLWDKAAEASRKLAAELGPFGFLARVQSPGWGTGETYVRAWTAAVAEMQEAALHGTIEVQSLSGRILGLVVTPLHPLRLAWHALYDQVAAHARYEQGLSHTATAQALQAIDGAHVPAMLPGADGVRGFLFGDTLGFHAVAMTPDGDREPKAAVALMAAALGGGDAVSPAIGTGSTSVLAREILHYLNRHRRQGRAEERPDLLNIQAWRAGDGMTVARARQSARCAGGSRGGSGDAPLLHARPLPPRTYGLGVRPIPH